MSFEEEFDNIIRQKTEGADFPFDEGNWEKMSRKLDEQKRGAGMMFNKKLFLAAAAILLLSLSGILFYNYFDNNDKKEITVNSTAPSQVDQPGAENNTMAGSQLNDKTLNSKSSEQGASSVASQPVTENVAAGRAVEKTVALAETSSQPGEQGNSAARVNKRAKPARSENEPVVQSDINKDQPKDQPQAENGDMNNEQSPIAALPKEELTKNQAPAGALTTEEFKNDAAPEQVEPLTMIQTQLPLEDSNPEVALAPVSMPVFYKEDYYKKDKYKTHFLNLEAGTTYLMGWQTNPGVDGKGFNWYAGVNYGIYLSRALSMSGGVQAYNISNIKQSFYTATETEFGFSATQNFTVITAKSLYYLAVPVRFSYALNAQNQLGAGVNVGYLVNASNSVETYNTSENGRSVPVKTSKSGAYEGIASSNIMLSAFYRTKVTTRLALNGEFIYGLTDLFKNTPTNKTNQNPMGFRVSLQYTLFDK